MLYCIFMIFSSMALFALVKSRVLSIKVQKSLGDIIDERTTEMEYYLAMIDQKLPDKKINAQIYDKCQKVMKKSFKYSVYGVFHKHSFFK